MENPRSFQFSTWELQFIEYDVILACYNYHDNIKAQTAEALNISVRTLVNKLHEMRLWGYEVKDNPRYFSPPERTKNMQKKRKNPGS